MIRDKIETDRYTLYLGDCLDVLPVLGQGLVDAVATDPPYSSGGAFRGDRTARALTKYVNSESQDLYTDFGGDSRDQRGFLAWCSLWLAAAKHASNPGAVACVFSDWRQLPVMTDCLQAGGWVWRNIGTWWKPGCRMQRGRFSSSAEFVVYGTNGAHSSDGENSPQNVFSFPTMQTDEKEHIAEKPVEVVSWCLSVTRPGALVLDPFMGSGTTGVACMKRGRRFIGIEIDPNYFAVSAKRIAKAAEEPPLFKLAREAEQFLFDPV